MPSGIYLNQEQIDYIRANFANKKNADLAKEMGISKTAIHNTARKYHLRKDRAFRHSLAVNSGRASSAARDKQFLNITQESIDKRAATFRKLREMEEIRFKWGLERKTKIKLIGEPRAKRDQRRHLIKRGYIIDERNLIAYWTEDTVRSMRLETRKKECVFKNYYSFKPYGELDKKGV